MHTPDPWRADPVYGGDSTWIMAHRLFRPDCGGSFCTIEHFGITGKRLPNAESTANVRLMVQSPALLGIAQDCLHQLSTDSDLDTILGAPKYRALVETLREVIARATGEEA